MAQVTFDTVELENFVKRLGTAARRAILSGH